MALREAHKFPLALEGRACGNGDLEWFLTLDEEPVYPTESRAGVFLPEEVRPSVALAKVLRVMAS